MRPPRDLDWVFWDLDVDALDTERDADAILARLLERGRLADVRWALAHYGEDRIHRFFRDVGHPEISERTTRFWRAVFRAEGERWASPAEFRRSSSAPWID